MARLTGQPIDLEAAVAEVRSPRAGALLTFEGVVRDHNRDKTVTGIEYHAYEPMAARRLDAIEAEARSRWPEARIHILHRLGLLNIGESSVVIAVSSPHRDTGFAALRFAIEEIKKTVPIWKKEIYQSGFEWIEGS